MNEKPMIWSYTFLHTWEICPFQAYRRFIKRDIPFVTTPAVERGSSIHKAMELRIQGAPLPDKYREFERFAAVFDGMNAIGEQSLGVTQAGASVGFWDKAAWGRGKLDVTVIDGTAAYIADWKSGKSRYEDPFELEIHAVLLHAKNPSLTALKGQYVYLGENHSSELYDLSDTLATWNRIGAQMREVEACQKAIRFEKRKNVLCGWCPVKDCEHNRS